MSEHVYIARQPIVTDSNMTYGYELLFRSLEEDGNLHTNYSDEMLATANVVVNVLNHIGIQEVVGEHLAFINVDKELLMDDILLTVPKDRFVIELLEHIIVDKEVVTRVKELKDLGYQLALDDANCHADFLENFQEILPFMDILKLDVSLIEIDKIQERLTELKSLDCKLLAEKVETKEQFDQYKAFGCELFQGYFFAKPDVIKKKALDPTYKRIFKLINLLDQDGSVESVALAFEDNPEITLQLLRFMNSSSLGLNAKIRSISHAINLLGKRALKQWLLLIAFAKSESHLGSFQSPLIELAQSRAKLMAELMKKFSEDSSRAHEAALVGVLSLIDVITQTSIEEVLAELDMDELIEKALIKHQGELGTLLKLAISIESFDIDNANFLLENLNLSQDTFQAALMASYRQN